MQGYPSALPYAVETTKALIGKKPIFGICMGHQILGQALGSSTFKLKFGHHGGNHPIRFNPSGAPRSVLAMRRWLCLQGQAWEAPWAITDAAIEEVAPSATLVKVAWHPAYATRACTVCH